MLSMHSIREMSASGDVQRMIDSMAIILSGGAT
jgi:aspartyl aminopeptidase